jgi:dTMP kinase
MNKKGYLKNFYCIEGADGSGKTTLTQELIKKDPSLCIGFEPTKGLWGKEIEKILKKEKTVSSLELLMLFIKDRQENQLWIKQRIKQGKTVVLDRYILSTLAYQGLYFSLEELYDYNKDFFKPKMIFFLDLPPKESLKRKKEKYAKEGDIEHIFEKEELQQQIYDNYLKAISFLEQKGYSIVKLEALKPIEELVLECYKYIEKG